MKLEFKINKKGESLVKHLKFSDRFWRQAGEIAVDGIVRNVISGKRSDGSAQKTNAPSTRRMKHRRGRLFGGVAMPLIDKKKRFAKPSGYEISVSRHSVTVSPSDKEVAEYVQQKGYTGWMVPSRAKFRSSIRKLVASAIKEAVRKASKHRSTRRK